MEMFEAIRKSEGCKDWGGRLVYLDYKYCFQPLVFQKMQGGRWYYNIPYAKKDFENLEVVARGILSQYIYHSDKQTVKEIFEKYYGKCFATYKDNKNKQHDIDIMLKPDDEIEALFVQAMLEEETIRIKSSMEKLEKYLTEDEFSVMQKVGDSFMAHLRSRLQELKPSPTAPSAKEFLSAFSALSRDCLMYIENKYDLGYKENPNTIPVLSPNMQHKIFDVLPGQIASRLNEGVITLANLNMVIEEIETNIDNCKTQPELERYVVELLEPFRAISDNRTIFQHENFEKQRAKIEEEMAKLGTPENCLNDLLYIMTKYANKLYAVLIQRDFDLGKFQDEVEIYLKRKWTWSDIAPYVGGKIRAQRLMDHEGTPSVNEPEENDGVCKPNYITNYEVFNVLPGIYAFLVKEKVIKGDKITCTDYVTAIDNADISKIYPNSVKYKFKTTIKAIQKCFTKEWFTAICKSAGIPEGSMGKSNFTDDTAKDQWFRKLNKVVTI